MNDTAYCVVTIDIRTERVIEVGIFSEERPTSMNLQHHLQVTAKTCTDESYAKAERRLVRSLREGLGATRWLYDRLPEHNRTGRP